MYDLLEISNVQLKIDLSDSFDIQIKDDSLKKNIDSFKKIKNINLNLNDKSIINRIKKLYLNIKNIDEHQFYNYVLFILGIRFYKQKLVNYNTSIYEIIKINLNRYRLYSLIIFGILIIMPTRYLIVLSNKYTQNGIINATANLAEPLQYIVLIYYYSFDELELNYNDNIKKSYTKLENLFIRLIDVPVNKNNKLILKSNLLTKLTVFSFIFTGSVSGYLIITSTIHEKYDMSYLVFIFTSGIIGREIIFISLITIYNSFFKHFNFIKSLINVIHNIDLTNYPDNVIFILIDIILQIRYSLRQSINLSLPILVISTFTGALLSYMIALDNNWTYRVLISQSLFIITDLIIYLIFVQFRELKSKLEMEIIKPDLIKKCENGGLDNWYILHKIVKEDWIDVTACGIPLTDRGTTIRLFALGSIITMFVKSGAISFVSN